MLDIWWQDEGWMLARLVVALLLGALVGYERERAAKPAGIRTHSMVSLGAALFTIVSIYGFGGKGDPGRVAAQIVTGVGFLGAGLILHLRGNVQGLTTATSLWVTAAIGMAAGVGMILMAVGTALMGYLVLRFGPRPRLSENNGEADENTTTGQRRHEE